MSRYNQTLQGNLKMKATRRELYFAPLNVIIIHHVVNYLIKKKLSKVILQWGILHRQH